MENEFLNYLKIKNILLEKSLFDIISEIENIEKKKRIIDLLEKISGQKIITKSILSKNKEAFQKVKNEIDKEDETILKKIFFEIGINLEATNEDLNENKNLKNEQNSSYKIFYSETNVNKKIEVEDFTNYFRSRYQQIQRILMGRPELSNLISIGKISSNRQNLSIIGIVSEKRTTRNKNIIIRLEDLTGTIDAIARPERKDAFEKAEELQLDEVIGIKANGNRDMLFIQDIIYPDALITEKTRFNEDISIAFISDIHAGSSLHLGDCFEKFIKWINEDEYAKKIKYIFFVGDNVDGVGIFPSQEKLLKLKSMREQYTLLASYLRKIPKEITMFMCPGQHDAVRVAEPQPVISKKYAAPLYEIENLVLVSNPAMIKLLERKKEFKILMYHGASIHTFINEIKELRESKAHKTPAKAVKYMLKKRHLAPTHSSVAYIPLAEKDPLTITEVPDILCTGEVHRLDIENYNGVLIITGSCWQSRTPYEEKVGNEPEPCKVPVFNLKTRELKIFDFSDS